MTEMNAVRPAFDPIAFFGALLLAPIVVAVLFFWVMLIPIYAVMFGTIPYLLFGGPVLLWITTHTRVTFWGCALGGLLAQAMFVISAAACLATGRATFLIPDEYFLRFLALWGIPFSAAWCGTFARLYHGFRPETVSGDGQSNPEPNTIS